MNKQELIDEINKTKEHLANMEKKLEECEYVRWKPKDCEDYWFLSTTLLPVATVNKNGLDRDRCNSYNCFKTEQEAKAEAEKILVRRMLEDIARKLNKGRKLEWGVHTKEKYCLDYDYDYGDVSQNINTLLQRQGTIYCLDENFTDIAIQEIGKERLRRYLRGE